MEARRRAGKRKRQSFTRAGTSKPFEPVERFVERRRRFPTYEAAHLADAGQKAVNLIETRGIDAARKIIDGEVPTEDGVLRTALMIEYEQKMLAEGNVEEYTRVLRLHTLEQTRRGICEF